MKRNNTLLFALLVSIVFTASSCQAIADIFKAGVWVGVLIVVVVIGVIFWLVGKARK
jgi:hypothetical protein